VNSRGVSVCVEDSKSDPRSQAQVEARAGARVEAQAAGSSHLPLPVWCKQHGVDNQYWANRFETCGVFSKRVSVVELRGKKPIVTGTMDFNFYNYIYAAGDNTTWANQIEISPWRITGTAADLSVTGNAVCTWSCPQMTRNSNFLPQTSTLTTSSYGESFFTWTGVPGDVTRVSPQWDVYFDAPTIVGATVLMTTNPAPAMRSDDALPNVVPGCAIPDVVTGSAYYSLSQFPTFGAHVAAAQASGLPGGQYPYPLHRLVNSVLQEQNRDTACPKNASLPRPDGFSCDEYPFASTFEGASTGGGTARTQDWCQVTLPGVPSTGSVGYSICMINAAENSLAGSLLQSQVFKPYRIIDRDAFYVAVTS
jgi:hypothetical protein